MKGLKPAVVGLIGAAVLSIAQTVLFHGDLSLDVFTGASIYLALGICVLMSVLAFKKVHPIVIVCISAVIGIAIGFLIPGVIV
jgi:chromate transporter